MKIPGMKGDLETGGAAGLVSQVNGKETFYMPYAEYFLPKKYCIIVSFIAVVVMVVCSVYAPKLHRVRQIDYISLRKF